MKKNYSTPEMEDFKYEIPTLYDATEASTGQSGTYDCPSHDEPAL